MIKKILIGLIGVIVILLLIGFAMPGKLETSKSISINAPAAYVFEEVNDLEKNAGWSYWNNLYKDNMTVAYGDIRAGVGAYSEWDGPESGKGSMTITESIPNESVKIDLDFMDQGMAKAWYTLESEGEGTKLTAGFNTELGWNPFMRWVGMLLIKPEMEKSFDYSLNRIKEIAEAKPTFTVVITEVTTTPISYIGIGTTMSFEDGEAISAQMAKSFGELWSTTQKAKVEITGPPFCLYPRWDEEKKEMDMICAVPVPADARLPEKYPVMQTTGGKAVKAIHKGSYQALESTHDQLARYIEYKKLEESGAVWEVYVTDPGTEPDTVKWVTEIYYPIKGQ